MREILGKRLALNLLAAIMIIGGIIFAASSAVSIYIGIQQITDEANKKVKGEVDRVHTYIDLEMLRVEDAAYGFASSIFGRTIRNEENQEVKVVVDPSHFRKPDRDEWYILLKQFLIANPHICGVCIGFKPGVYESENDSVTGFAPYVAQIGPDDIRHTDIATKRDYYNWEWWTIPATSGKGNWNKPIREGIANTFISSYSIPLYNAQDSLIGVLAMDINLESFTKKCSSVTPYEQSAITMLDQYSNYIVKPTVDLSDKYVFEYTDTIKRANWTLKLQCAKSEVFEGVDRMILINSIIAVISILILAVLLLYIFRKVQFELLEKAGMQSELNVAAGIQMGMLPKLYPPFPDRKEIDVFGMLVPAKEVGGDLFDYFVRDDKLFFCIGDVSGKGVPASLFMAVLRSLFRNVSQQSDSPAFIVQALNKALSEGNEQNMFCTMFVGVLSLTDGKLHYCNAGHNAPVVLKTRNDKTTSEYADIEINIAIGIVENFEYEEESVQMAPKDAILLYTDGVTEAENPQKELFGEERLLDELNKFTTRTDITSQSLVNGVYEHLKNYTNGCQQSDDITMVMIAYK